MRESIHRKLFMYMALIALISLPSGCGTRQDARSPDTVPESGGSAAETPQPASVMNDAHARWKVRYSATCAQIPENQCPAFHGFSIDSDGNYEIGPAPQGDFIVARLAPQDLADARAMVASARTDCVAGDSGRVELTTGAGKQDAACDINLLGLMKRFVDKYHPRTFPSPCSSATHVLDISLAKVTRCDTDSDCALLDDTYRPLGHGAVGTLVVDDCTLIRPLVAANAFEAVASQRKLLMKREIARKVCGMEILRPGCNQTTTLNPADAVPVCDAGYCQVRF